MAFSTLSRAQTFLLCRSLSLVLFLLLKFTSVVSSTSSVHTDTSSALVKSRSKVSAHSSRLINPKPSGNIPKSINVVQIVESEQYDGTNWVGHTMRWTNINGEECADPIATTPTEGFQFEGDWKIVTSANRDSLGWEYIWTLHQPALRRRLWLRSMVPIPKQSSTSLVSTLRDQWNFKGFGLSLYKSLTFANSFGMALRLPIMSNIEWWERNPALPMFSTAVACYFPWAAIYQISGSLNVDFLAWVLGRTFRYSLYGASVLLLAICQVMFMPLALLLYPARRQLVLPSFPLPTIPTAPPIFSLAISQRLGMSVNWRFTWSSGCELRLAYYYECMPTVLYLTELIRRSSAEAEVVKSTYLMSWLRRKAAALGLACGVPLPVPPYYFCTAALSMSGFYFRSPKKQQLQQQQKQQEILSTTKPNIETSMDEDVEIVSKMIAEESSSTKTILSAAS